MISMSAVTEYNERILFDVFLLYLNVFFNIVYRVLWSN